ncbi:hypothetical protein LguiA_004742 [Lonicera macranthoides]
MSRGSDGISIKGPTSIAAEVDPPSSRIGNREGLEEEPPRPGDRAERPIAVDGREVSVA